MTTDTDTAVALDGIAHWIDVLVEANTLIAQLDERKKVAREHIENALGDAEIGTVDGVARVRWSRVVSRRLDQAKAKRLLEQAGTLDAAMVEATSRRFALVDVEAGDES